MQLLRPLDTTPRDVENARTIAALYEQLRPRQDSINRLARLYAVEPQEEDEEVSFELRRTIVKTSIMKEEAAEAAPRDEAPMDEDDDE